MSYHNDSPSPSQDSDEAIVAMLDKMLADDDLFVEPNYESGYELLEYTADGKLLISTHNTRVDAYRAAIDTLIDLCVDAWDKGGQE